MLDHLISNQGQLKKGVVNEVKKTEAFASAAVGPCVSALRPGMFEDGWEA